MHLVLLRRLFSVSQNCCLYRARLYHAQYLCLDRRVDPATANADAPRLGLVEPYTGLVSIW
jgi:hypothetical protein